MTTRQAVLFRLEAHRGQSLSGEALAEGLGVSRNAIWKAVGELRTEGFDILSGTNRGYMLSESCDKLSEPGVFAHLQILSNPVKSFSLHVFDSLESSNKTAKELALQGAPNGTAVICNQQTAGRGRYGRSFSSPPGTGLYMSLVLRPNDDSKTGLPLENPTHLTIRAAVAVTDALLTLTDLEPRIKWVNDILIRDKKVCGILTEGVTDFESGGIAWLVVGIGINVTTPTESFPPALQPIATALYPRGNPPFTRNQLAAEILTNLCDTTPTWKTILDRYKHRLCMLSKQVTVVQGDTTYKAKAMDIDPDGHLIVETAQGGTKTLSSGEIRIKL